MKATDVPEAIPNYASSADTTPNAWVLNSHHSEGPSQVDFESPESTEKVGLINDRFKATRKSRSGCQTCKFRKKKCDDTKPVCGDCQRLGKECVWVDYSSMNKEQIRLLREKVEKKERNSKLRKRKKSPQVSGDSTRNASLNLKPDSEMFNETSNIQLPHSNVKFGLEAEPTPRIKPNISVKSPPESNFGILKTEPHEPIQNNVGGHFQNSAEANFSGVPMGFQENVGFEDFNPGYSDKFMSFTNFFKAANGHDSESSSAFLHFLKDLSHSNATSPRLHTMPHDPVSHVNVFPQEPTPTTTQTDAYAKLPLSPMKTHNDADIQLNGSQLFDLASGFMSSYSPSPQPSLSLLPELNSHDLYLYNYYCETLSKKVSIAPSTNVDSNYYQRVFLPLAQEDKGVLYGILAWAGFHLGGKWMAEGSQYAKLAASHLNNSIGGGFIEDIDLDSPKALDLETGVVNPQTNRRAIINKLATLLILCGAEICRGDIKYWSVFLKWGANLLKMNGGIMNFNNNKEEHWLISNFAYHDLLASSTVERGTYFPTEVYSEIFRDKAGISKGNINPLLGVSKSLFKVIGDISQLSREAKSGDVEMAPFNLAEPTSLESELEPGNSNSRRKKFVVEFQGQQFAHISSISERALHLEAVIDELKPESEDLENLLETDWELQLTTFEALKLACKLYLRQAVFRINPSSLESRVLTSKLIGRIDVLLHTSVQATLVFPIFMAGIHCISVHERELMRLRFEDFMKSYGPWNIVRVKAVVEKVWSINCMGDLAVDWNDMLNEMGWELNFA